MKSEHCIGCSLPTNTISQRKRVASQPRVLLLSLPWTAVSEPSLGLGVLKARLDEVDIPCRIIHLNIFLLKYLRITTYSAVAGVFALNDFLFGYAIDRDPDRVQLDKLRDIVHDMNVEGLLESTGYSTEESFTKSLLTIRHEVIPRYLGDCLEMVVAAEPDLIGFTCMFDQTIASAALAKLVRQHLPKSLIAFGGYALEGPAGGQIMRSFPWVDCVAEGEGEDIIAPLARASLNPSLLASIPGLLYRTATTSDVAGAAEPFYSFSRSSVPKVRPNINSSPAPNYDDYFVDIAALSDQHQVKLGFDTLPIETSRGCWWGQRHHCVFCGIDDDTMKYRAKSPELAFNQLSELRDRYGFDHFRISDYILPSTYYKTLLPRLASMGDSEKFNLTCEIKANMTADKFRLMRDAGFSEVQPGIESFSSSVLKKMDKGVSAIQNLQTLMLGRLLGIRVHYNFLYGFPHDEAAEYDELVKIIPLLYHLEPPNSMNQVQITRFAPLQVSPGRFPMPPADRPHPYYDVVFSRQFLESHSFNLSNYCYYFEHSYENSPDLQHLYKILEFQVAHWKKVHSNHEARLSYEVTEQGIAFTDSRYGNPPRVLRFGLSHARLYLILGEGIQGIPSLEREHRDDACGQSLHAILRDFDRYRLIFREGQQVIGLALPENIYSKTRPPSTGKWAAPYA